jgi:serine/threonine-protein kinase HipA
MARKAKVYMKDTLAGFLEEVETGYCFIYANDYVQTENAEAISNTMPIKNEPYLSNVLFPFFDGLIPEGWLLDIAEKNWKLKEKDRMGLLLTFCKNCIGAVSIIEDNEKI